jgi:hypothetical protein
MNVSNLFVRFWCFFVRISKTALQPYEIKKIDNGEVLKGDLELVAGSQTTSKQEVITNIERCWWRHLMEYIHSDLMKLGESLGNVLQKFIELVIKTRYISYCGSIYKSKIYVYFIYWVFSIFVEHYLVILIHLVIRNHQVKYFEYIYFGRLCLHQELH